MTNFGWT